MIESVEELRIYPQRDAFRDRETLGDIHVGVSEVWPAHGVAACISELAIGDGIATGTGPIGRVHHGAKGVGIQPLFRARYGYIRIGRLAIEGHAGDSSGKLRPTRLKDTMATGRIGLA